MFEVFFTTLQQMLAFFALMLIGYFMTKKKILPDAADRSVSNLLTKLFIPCLTLRTFAKNCTVENLRTKWVFMVFSIVLVAIAFLIATVLKRLFAPDDLYLQTIYRYSFTLANYGYMGNAIVLALFGDDALFDYMMFTLPMSVFLYVYLFASLDPRGGGKFRLKSLLNPAFLAVPAGALIGLLPFQYPADLPAWLKFIPSVLDSAANCMSPCAMLLAGIVVGKFQLKELFGDRKVYYASIIRLLVLPAAFSLLVRGFFAVTGITGDWTGTLMRSVLTATAMPLGLNTVVVPASFGADTRPGAGMALVSNLMSLITIPLMFMLFLPR